MAKPKLVINQHDYTEYIESMEPTINALDADGSGRDVQTGTMIRTLVALKQSWAVKLVRIPSSIMLQLIGDVMVQFYSATFINPTTGAEVTKTMYTSSVPCGAVRYVKDGNGAIEYAGVSFNMIER